MEAAPIRTPDQRLRVFVSSTLGELQPERAAVRAAVESLHLAPVMFELGARPHPPRSLYRSYLAQSDIFLGIYWERYGYTAPGEDVSGLEDEYRLSGDLPALIYLKTPAPQRESELTALIGRIRDDDRVSYKSFSDPNELADLVVNDLATLLADRFDATGAAPETAEVEAPTPTSSIPAAYTAIVGRERDRTAVIGMLRRPDVRLVTLVGPGGIGKSRLAIDVATTVAATGVDVAFTLLESVTSAEGVLPAIARALGVRDSSDAGAEAAILTAVQGRDLLLVVDNLEHLLDASDALVRLITAAPTLTVLATSRSPLRVRAEYAYDVGPLAAPGEGEALDAVAAASSVQLFVQRATAVLPSFALTAENAATVAAICRALDGVPLAIELAAARVRSFSPEEILERLDSALSLLADGARDLPPRQRTIRSTIEWSCRLLDEPTRAALAALAVFTGPFTRAAAEAVLEGMPDVDPSDAIDALVDASLLQRRDRGGVRVFALLSTVRAYASGLGADDATRERWVAHYRDWTLRATEGLRGADQQLWRRRLDAEAENLAGVVRFLLDGGRFDEGARFSWSMYLFIWLAGLLGLMQSWMAGMLAATRRDGVELTPWTEAVALYYAHAIEFWQHPESDVVPGLTRGTELFEQAGDQASAALTRVSLALALLAQPTGPDVPGAQEQLARAIAEFAGAGSRWGEAMALVTMGRLELLIGDLDSARERFERSLRLARAEQEGLGIVIAQNHRGWVRFLSGDLDGAAGDFAESLDGSFALAHDEGIAYGLEGLAGLAAARGRADHAGLLLGAADAVRRRSGSVNTAGFALYTPAIETLRQQGSGAELDAASARGGAMSPREVLDAVGA